MSLAHWRLTLGTALLRPLQEAATSLSVIVAAIGQGTGQVPAHPHDSGSQANETVDGLDATTESLRHAAEDTHTGIGPRDIEKTPVFDRAGEAPRI